MFHQEKQVEWLTNATEKDINDLSDLCRTAGVDVAETIQKIAACEIPLYPYTRPDEFIHESNGTFVALCSHTRGWVINAQDLSKETAALDDGDSAVILVGPQHVDWCISIVGRDRELVRKICGFLCLCPSETEWSTTQLTDARKAAEAFNVPYKKVEEKANERK